MVRMVGVRFRPAGKVYDFLLDGQDVAVGEQVLVETARGTELGQVVTAPREVESPANPGEVKRVLRRAAPEDMQRARANRERAARALALCREKAAARGLAMRPVEAEFSFNGRRVTIYFTAEGRVDFRDLVRDLSAALKARVEFRQIGVRDAAKMLGGLGPCGRPVCCATFLTEFRPVAIRMAKEQNLALNPAKISGLCGRLMCCLRYESSACCLAAGGDRGAEGEAGTAAEGAVAGRGPRGERGRAQGRR